MQEVCSALERTLQEELKERWTDLFNQNFAELVAGRETGFQPVKGNLQAPELDSLRKEWWKRTEQHRQTWCKRQANGIYRKHARKHSDQELETKSIPESAINAANERLYHAVRQLILVQRLIDGNLTSKQEKLLREELWLELAPQVERIAHCYQKSAAKRGFEVEDLIQDASAHFQQVITRFNPEDQRRAMPATWFDDVVDNLFTAAVRPRKSDPFKRGVGETGEAEGSDDLPDAPKPSVQYVRDYQRQKELEDSLRQIDEICCQLVDNGTCPFERVLAFKLYVSEGLTYQEVAQALKSQGYNYGTTQMFNFVKEVKAHVLSKIKAES